MPRYFVRNFALSSQRNAAAALSIVAIVLAALMPGVSAAAENVPLLKDLSATLKLLNLPCGQVVAASPQTENDQLATCSDGNRYRIFVNRDGRVVAERR